MAEKSGSGLTDTELEWIRMEQNAKPIFQETNKEKFIRKFKENPLVPLGCLATGAALGCGLYSFRVGNKRMSQMMMRTRVLAQGFTIAALVVGLYFSYGKNNQLERDHPYLCKNIVFLTLIILNTSKIYNSVSF